MMFLDSRGVLLSGSSLIFRDACSEAMGWRRSMIFFKHIVSSRVRQVEFFLERNINLESFAQKKSKYIPICKSQTSNQLANHWEATVGQQFFSKLNEVFAIKLEARMLRGCNLCNIWRLGAFHLFSASLAKKLIHKTSVPLGYTYQSSLFLQIVKQNITTKWHLK